MQSAATFEADFHRRCADIGLDVLVQHQDTVTLTDLAELVHSPIGQGLATVTIGDLLRRRLAPAEQASASNPAPQVAKAPATQAAKMPAQAAKAPAGQARTLADRETYHKAIVKALRGKDWIALSDLQLHVGGTLNQLRRAVQRLVDDDRLERRGERNATTYRLASS